MGSHGFFIPKGWAESPLRNYGGPGWFASVTNSPEPGVIAYEKNGGSAGVIYTSQGSAEVPNLAGALRVPTCTVTSHAVVADNAVLYTCAPVGGLAITGAVVIRPYPEGFRWVEARLPALMAPMGQQIAGSLTTPPLVRGPYGFDVPKGWSVGPLQNSGGSGSFATVTDPQHRVKISYVAEGGNSSVVNRDGSVNVRQALAGAGCPITYAVQASAYELFYECTPAAQSGQLAGAILLPAQYSSVHWWKLVTVSGPPDQLALAAQVLDSLRWSSP